ncbi:MAG: redoxin family protein [Motiliproteus sp.]
MKRITSQQVFSWVGQLLLFSILWLGISAWQQKDLLQDAIAAPAFSLISLAGETVRLGDIQAERTLLYFFAPWCSICKLSIGNLNELNADKSLAVVAVALSYQSPAEITEFVGDQALDVPVLLGTQQTLTEYKIEMFPTYYVLDANKRVISKSVGYSTELGMKLRSWSG